MKEDKNMKKYHYVYAILNKTNRKCYIGKRSSNIEPHLDLGIKYISSSTDKSFIEEQKLNKNNFKYIILRTFETSKTAISFEVSLHNLFNVSENDNFYNKAKQTSVGFDLTGNVTVKDKDGNTMSVSLQDKRYLSGELIHNWCGNKHKLESVDKLKQTLFTNETHKGCNNSQYNTIWISNVHTKESIKINKDDLELYECLGFVKGRNVWNEELNYINKKEYEKQYYYNKVKNNPNHKFRKIKEEKDLIELHKIESNMLKQKEYDDKCKLASYYYNEYRKFGFELFCEIHNYTKTIQNFSTFLRRYCKEYKPLNGSRWTTTK